MTARLPGNFNSPTLRPTIKNYASDVNARLVRSIAIINLADVQIVSGDTITLPTVPKGARGIHHRLTASATMGATATLAIGITGTTGKYRTAAVFTAVDTPTIAAKAANLAAAQLAADEPQFITIAAADLPASGTLVVETFYTIDAK